MNDDNTVWQPIEPTTPNAYPSAYSNPYGGIPIPPPPPTPKRPSWWVLAVALVIALLLFAATGLVYEAHSLLTSQVKPTPIVRAVPVTPTAPVLTPTVLLNRTPATSNAGSSMPAFLTSYSPPSAGLPYTSLTVYNTLLLERIKMNSVQYNNGWDCCVAYQPEGKIVSWEEAYSVVVEVATFSTPTEAETDASDLLANSSGFSVYTKNLCVLFYDNTISNTSLANYISGMSAVCK